MKKGAFFHHVKLDVADIDRSLAFYVGKLQWKIIVRYDRPDGVIIVQVSPTGAPPGIELWQETPFARLSDDRLHIAIGVDDVDQAIERLRKLGARIEREPFTMGKETIGFIRDPDNYLIELNSMLE
jgi:catechol 2,3-dioxygenase-like lactoylglutathione lyase family enzyme